MDQTVLQGNDITTLQEVAKKKQTQIPLGNTILAGYYITKDKENST